MNERLLYLILFLVVPFIVGAIAKMVSSSISTDKDDGFALMKPYYGLGYWLDGLAILLIAGPWIAIIFLYITTDFSMKI